MKKVQTLIIAAALLFVTLSQSGCIGSFQLTSNLYNWNKSEVGGKWGQELVFFAFCVIPVYEICLFADAIVLNAIEFWTGSNPLAMTDGEKDSRIVQNGDDVYKLTATRNMMKVEKLAGKNQGEEVAFVYNPETSSWSVDPDSMK